jgi:hypothetical protein
VALQIAIGVAAGAFLWFVARPQLMGWQRARIDAWRQRQEWAHGEAPAEAPLRQRIFGAVAFVVIVVFFAASVVARRWPVSGALGVFIALAGATWVRQHVFPTGGGDSE